MKNKLMLSILVLLLISCTWQQSNKESSKNELEIESTILLDTLSVLAINQNDRVIHLSYYESLKEEIKLVKGNSVLYSIELPISDDDIKNFVIDQIDKIENGFSLYTSWGGGNYFYSRNFYFEFDNGHYYLNRIDSKSYNQELDKEKLEENKIIPPVRIDSLNILEYLKNNW